MQRRVFVVSDLHLGHENLAVKFLKADGSKCRPFTTLEEHDETLIANWNDTVALCDKVYILGDVAIRRRSLALLGRMNGDKVLIKGNHDIFKLTDYTPWFRDIRACHPMPKESLILTHIPIHPSQLERFKGNVHGHTHEHLMDDPRYINVCVEHTDYRPIELSVVQQRLALAQQEIEHAVG